MQFTGLEHTAIASPSPKRLADWYVHTLGWIINFEYDGNYFVRAPNGAMLEIIPAQVEFTGEPFENQGNRLVFFKDADGNLLHLIARQKPLP